MDDIKVGNKYFAWTVIALDDGQHHGKVKCRCACGREKWLFRSPLRTGKTKSCGCGAYKPLKDYGGLKIGDKIGSWTLLKRKQDEFYCRCECGTKRWVPALRLMRGKSLSCGCKRINSQDKQSQNAMKVGHMLHHALGKEKVGVKYSGFGRKNNKNSKTGITGVSLMRNGKYRAYIYLGKKQICLGVFRNIDDAANSRREAEKKYFTIRQKKADKIMEEIKWKKK